MCAMISAASRGRALEGLKVTMACVTREEGDSLGVETLIDAGGDYDSAVFGEPAGAARVAVGYRGRTEARFDRADARRARLLLVGPPERRRRVLGVMSQMQGVREEEHRRGKTTTRSVNASLTIIEGGSYSNVIPKKCQMTFDVSIPPGMSSSAQ